MKIDPFINVMGFKKYDAFEDIQDILHAVYHFGFKKGYDANTQGELLGKDLKSAYDLGCAQCGKNSNCSGCIDTEEEISVSDYDIGYMEGYNEGYIHGREKSNTAEIEDDKGFEDEWCECRELGFSQGIDTGYVNGYKDALLGIPSWIHDEELEELIKHKKG